MLYKIRSIPQIAGQFSGRLIEDALVLANGLPDSRLRGALTRPIYKLNVLQHLLTAGNPGCLEILHGAEGCGGQPMTVAFLGNWSSAQSKALPFFQHLFFGENPVTSEPAERLAAGQFRRRAEALDGAVDLVAVRCSCLLSWRPIRGLWMRSPDRIRMVFHFHPGEAWAAIEKRMGQRYNISVLKRSGLRYRISQEEKDFTTFYHEMYIPMVQCRYKEYADIQHEEGLRSVFRRGGSIMQIVNARGQAIAGWMQYPNHRVVYALVNGVYQGDQELVHQGALSACYYYGLQWAFEHGYLRLDSGICAPFSTNGIYIHKHRWGFEPDIDRWKPAELMLWSPNESPAALAWMKENPMLPQFAETNMAG